MDSINTLGSTGNAADVKPGGLPSGADAAPVNERKTAPIVPATDALKAAVDAANQALAQSNQGFAFEFDDTLKGVSVKIVDKQTNMVLHLVPSEQMLGTAEKLAQAPAPGAILKSEA